MPSLRRLGPQSLENLSLQAYISLLKNETELLFHLRAYAPKSTLVNRVSPDILFRRLETQFISGLHGILQDIVRQRVVEHIVKNFHVFMNECVLTTKSCKTYQILSEQSTNNDFCQLRPSTSGDESVSGSPGRYNMTNLRLLPIFQQLMLILNDDVKVLDFSKNKDLVESEEGTEICRVLWKVVGERCKSLEKLILTKDLTYSSTLNSVIVNGSQLTHLTLKRNVPNNIFLNLIGQNCPKLQELDVAGSEIINDFGIVCLLFADPEQIFLKCWNREKTVGSQVRRNLRVFPQPYYDRQIPDQQPNQPNPRNSKSTSGNYLYLKKTFHEALRSGEGGDWERLPVATSIKKFRLENTRVKGDGASVVLESCPNIYSLGYLVFAAAGLKQVFGFEEEAATNMTEIFYRGPSDQKLLTIANCCPNLKTLFLGSNNPRTLHHRIFKNWRSLSYLTLENIVVESVISCLEVVGPQIKGLKLQCTHLNLPDIAALCPQLQSLIIQKESPSVIKYTGFRGSDMLSKLQHLEVASSTFSKSCMEFVLTQAIRIVSIKVLCVPKLTRQDLEDWFSNNPLNNLKSLIILRGPCMTLDSSLNIMKELPAITEIGISDLNLGDVAKSIELKKLQLEIKKRDWDVNLVDFGTASQDPEERDFSKLQTANLHWFYLTPNEGKKNELNSGMCLAR